MKEITEILKTIKISVNYIMKLRCNAHHKFLGKCLDRLLHFHRVPDGKSDVPSTKLIFAFLCQLCRHQQCSQSAASAHQKCIVGIIYRLLLKNVIDSTRLAVIVQIVPYHFRIQPSAGFRRKIFMVYLSQPTGNAILDGHADRIPLIDPININPPHTEQLSLYPLIKAMFSCPAGAAAVESVNRLCFLVQRGYGDLVIFRNAVKPFVIFVPNPKMIIIRLVSP